MISFRKKLAEWLYPVDMAALTRQNLNNIKVDTSYIDELPMEEYKDFLNKTREIWLNPAFKVIRDHLASVQVDYVAREAQDVRQMDFARASINGVSLFWEEVQHLNSLFESLAKTDEKYDRNEIL